MTRRTSVAAIGGLVLALAVLALGFVLLRPSSEATVGNGVTVACDGVGSPAACERWASQLLAEGPGIHTFDPDDLAHLRLTQPFLLPGDCEAAYFLGRNLDEPAAREAVACPAQ